jgi:hypothetical protein
MSVAYIIPPVIAAAYSHGSITAPRRHQQQTHHLRTNRHLILAFVGIGTITNNDDDNTKLAEQSIEKQWRQQALAEQWNSKRGVSPQSWRRKVLTARHGRRAANWSVLGTFQTDFAQC